MQSHTHYPIIHLNTFGVGGVAQRYVRFDADTEIAGFLRDTPLGDCPYLILGGGSNLLFTGDYPGMLLHPAFKGVTVLGDDGYHVRIRAMAGETWDDLVAFSVENGWGGIENLSLIPGHVGASAVQNIGAYGVEVETVVEQVEAIALDGGETVHLTAGECGFGYRSSHFKSRWAGRFIVTAVVFRLRRTPRYVLDYPGVREGVERRGAVNLKTIRQTIISIRQAKLPDPAETGNAGSFFKNPVVDSGILQTLLNRYPDLPHYPQGEERFKLAAGWLIERCGWKGRHVGRAAVHDRQALVLVNRGGATGREILDLSETIAASVADHFGVRLEREVRVV
ncbi:UDP-N-acetylmuramate dehydrogenase [Desulfosarcina ovata]|uniref:UDP-N-acetylenolpyruvoylglucosamine reductase n=1 Tax=Desulfosarcina ovata subsp. ovata TaxID=2752305 RepID=A0A5K8AFN1_9BACT|nr:UDP-N-acetylmuramate dehydrogenase [Desulfosarcina ovata]BBO91318.1 UDP-N-acetylenolpyruvoylglucosamine reductase [Desulfosarcina ovata subsp. ovata]